MQDWLGAGIKAKPRVAIRVQTRMYIQAQAEKGIKGRISPLKYPALA